MTLLGKVATMIPGRGRNLAVRWRDQTRLSRIRTIACEPTHLGHIDRARLDQVLSDPAVDAEWPSIKAELEAFTITSEAGGVNPGDRRALYHLVRAFRPRRVLEIGTHIGASTVHIAAALRANAAAAGPPVDLVTVDIVDVNEFTTRRWERYGSRFAPAEMIERMGLALNVRFVACGSLAYLAESGDDFDLIFLDGDHSAATVYREVPAALRRLSPEGLILLHDFFPQCRPLWPGDPVISGPWLAIERLRREGADVYGLPLGELRWPTKRGRSVTSLAILSRKE
jgi:predicted O-methyltransferase YrrM